MKVLTVDRLEGNYVICEDGEKRFFAIEKEEAPADVKEGDVLRIGDDGELTIDREETERRKKRVRERQSKLWES